MFIALNSVLTTEDKKTHLSGAVELTECFTNHSLHRPHDIHGRWIGHSYHHMFTDEKSDAPRSQDAYNVTELESG